MSSKICFYFHLKDNSTSTHFLLATNCEIYWLHTVNVSKLMIQKQLGWKILRLLNQYCVNWQVHATILTHQTSIICGSHLISGVMKLLTTFILYFIYKFGLIFNAFFWSQNISNLACLHCFTARKQKGSPSMVNRIS